MTDSTQVPGSEKPKNRKAGCLTIIALFIGAIIVFGIVGSIIQGPKDNLVDTTFAPVIAALEIYKSKNGRYPDNLDLLVPAYLTSMPSCPDSSKPGAAYYLDPKSGGYILGCYTFLFTKRLYNSGTKTWESSD